MAYLDAIPHTHTFRAMNCQMTAWVCTDDGGAAGAALQAVARWMQRVDLELSRFRPDSDLSRLNAAGGRPYRAGALLWEVTREALAAAQASRGIFDPTIGLDLVAAGYDRSFEQLATLAGEPVSPMTRDEARRSRWEDIHLDPRHRTITLPPDVRLDLGGIAKGWAADRALALLRPLGPAMVDAGGDLAIGDAPPGEMGWPVATADPFSPDGDLALLVLSEVGLATSGTDHRRWQHGSRSQHHLIDPDRGVPAPTDILTATVIAPTATAADALASSLVIMGLDAAADWAHHHPNTPVLLVLTDGRIYQNPAFARYARAYFPAYA